MAPRFPSLIAALQWKPPVLLGGGRDLRPPEVMEEYGPWLYGPPTWVGIGAMKSGTTWWHRNITDHPQAVVAKVPGWQYGRPDYVGKQLHFFDSFCHRP